MASYLAEEDLDEEKARRSIVVSNLPEDVTYKDVIIHFQRERNGGGEVDSARYPDSRDPSTVIVTFDDPETVETAINYQYHSLGGTNIIVKRYPVIPFIPEVFEYVQARVNPVLAHSPVFNQDVLNILQGEYGVEMKKSNSVNSFYLIGSLKQITLCHDFIFENICSQHQTAASRPIAADEARGATSRKESSARRESSRPEEIKNTVYQTVPVIWKYIITVPKYRKQLVQIEKDHDIRVREIENGNKVEIIPSPNCTKKKFEEGCEEYIELYRKFFQESMMSKEVVLTPGPGTSFFTAHEAIGEVQPHASVIIERTTARDTWLFYGEEKEVKKTVKDICKLLNIDHPFKRASRKHVDDAEREGTVESGAGSNVAESAGPVDRDSTTNSDNKAVEEFLTKKGFRLSVRQSDITEEHVDAIVNCNDEFLHGFSSGLPKAIVEKGGNFIFKEVEAQTKRRIVKPGEIIMTGGGQLSCTKILHVITWTGTKGKDVQKNMVQDACLDCLRKAQSKSLKSIAFPAVGTGKVGMALKNCVPAMVNAVDEYMRTSDPKKHAVTDIRFVHVDSVAFEAFKQELQKRYGASRVKSRDGNKEPQTKPGIQDDKSSGRLADDHKSGNKIEKDVCPICLDHFTDSVFLQKCKHQFCRACIDAAFKHKNKCPTCGETYGVQTGNMPQGTMRYGVCSYRKLPGHELYGTIEINYYFPSGTQGQEHPSPGQRYSGTSRTAYLPDSPEGREVLALLRKAFDARLTFTIGTSVTTGLQNTVTWNDIHHKTNIHGGATGFGYPDPDYLKRVKEELAAKGIA